MRLEYSASGNPRARFADKDSVFVYTKDGESLIFIEYLDVVVRWR